MALWTVRRVCRTNTNRILRLLDRDGNNCWICRTKLDLTMVDDWFPHITVDHVIPRSKGGTRCPDNIRLAHKYCNHVLKGNLSPEEFRKKIPGFFVVGYIQ